ncbi:hypothetical protein FHW69_002844 [Luteibacter sp. Sphag1AF]|uniref:hypothetical protein n=1 Tax=Luteibacter sp. Sphag1AF TaxID=2587031 RepID=UPI0016218B79|nr:hypothetical protein [Luteibacter sp. Sphag1AF]MBB3228209.1 hypothetical protein [Luteibacter sp. Sphag1AF]
MDVSLNPEIVSNHALTSFSAVKFLDYCVTQGRCMKRLNLLDDSLPVFLRNYKYPLQSWPWFIVDSMQKTLQDAACRVPALIYKAVQAEFAGDAKRFAEFYRMPDILGEIFMQSGMDLSQIMLRVDAVMTSRGLKIMEINAGPNIGGWQIQWMDKQYRKQPALASFFETTECRSRNIPRNYMKHLIEQGRARCNSPDDPVNVLFVLQGSELTDDSVDTFRTLFEEALHECQLPGEIILEPDFSDVVFDHTGAYVRGKRVTSLAAFHHETTIELPRELYRCFLGGKVYWPGNPFVMVIGDKRSLAIANNHKNTSLFNDEERRLIETHVPWSAAIVSGPVEFDGVTGDLETLLLERREDFVIKIARGSSGKDVYVGRFQPADVWQGVVRRAFSEGAWMAQEYCLSLPFYGQSGEEGYGIHDVIWGAFGFGTGYGGCWLRLMAKDAGDGVINSATGAMEAIVYEVYE